MNTKAFYFTRKLYIGVINTAIVVLLLMSFRRLWDQYFSLLLAGTFGQGGKNMMTLLYGVVLIFFLNTWGGFKMDHYKYLNLMLSQVLAILVSNAALAVQMILMVGIRAEAPAICGEIGIMTLKNVAEIVVILAIVCALYLRLFPPTQLLMISGKADNRLLNKIKTREDKYQITETLLVKENITAEDLKIMEQYNAILLNEVSDSVKKKVMQYCYTHSTRLYFTPDISDIFVRGTDNINLFDSPILLSKNSGINYERFFIKRCFDVVFSLLVLILFSPLYLILAIAVKLQDGGPVIYKQKRCTLRGKTFEIYKFRSMIVDAEKNGEAIPAIDDDPRITPLGKFLRRWHLDEMPQFVNVLKGDMSVVGPRPERVENVAKYTEEIPEFAYRMKMRAGITGYAQVYGKYNTSAEDKLKMDLQYIVDFSFLLDLQILLETIKVLFQKEKIEGFNQHE